MKVAIVSWSYDEKNELGLRQYGWIEAVLVNCYNQMQNISTVQGKLLFFVHGLAARKTITPKEHGQLKDFIIENNQLIIHAYQSYLKDGTELTLFNQLQKLLKCEKNSFLATEENEGESASSRSKSSRKIKKQMYIRIPTRNIQRLPGHQNRI